MATSAYLSRFLALGLSFAIAITGLSGLPAPAQAAQKGFSAIAIDARTGKVLVAREADTPRYPASITKVMTLYVLFEDMKAGRFNKKTRFKVSSKASKQQPSKLGLKPGSTISVDDAIKALVTRSANDVAMVVAENVAGSQAKFADRMNATAKKLGMTKSNFRNPSGLPDRKQVSTARDIATLSLRIQRDFPEYYGYFKMPSFVYKGKTIRTHNKLLGKFEGTDGIKTGYIGAAGYNLTTSAARGNKRLIGVVLGASSGGARNRYMMNMLEPLFKKATNGSHIALVAGNPPGYKPPKQQAANFNNGNADEALFAMAKSKPVAGTIAIPLPRKKPDVPVILEARLEEPELAPEAPTSQPGDETDNEDGADTTDSEDGATTFTAVVVEEASQDDVAAMVSSEPILAREDTKAIFSDGELKWPESASGKKTNFGARNPEQTASTDKIEGAQTPEVPEILPEPRPQEVVIAAQEQATESWMVQIGSWKEQSYAERRLDKAQSLKIEALEGKTPIAMAVEQSGKTIFTARFMGFDNEKDARNACQVLSRKGFGCVSLAPGQSG